MQDDKYRGLRIELEE